MVAIDDDNNSDDADDEYVIAGIMDPYELLQ